MGGQIHRAPARVRPQVNRQEKHLRYEQHRDNADELLRQADNAAGPVTATAGAARAQAHATLALVYLTDLQDQSAG